MSLPMIRDWVKMIAVGDCLTLNDEVWPRRPEGALDLDHKGQGFRIEYGDVLQVVSVTGSKGRGMRILCMTKAGPLPLSPWLVSCWFRAC